MNTMILGKNDATEKQGLQPLPHTRAIWHFLLAGFGIRLSSYTILPFLIKQGLPQFEAFVVAFMVPTAVLFALAFGAVKQENVSLTVRALAERFRLRRLRWQDAVWMIFAIFILAGSFIFTPTQIWLLHTFPALQPPASFPALLNPLMQNEVLPTTISTWMGPQAAGNWGWAVLVLLLFFFNIFGEELYWRGVLLPRQELVNGRYTWVIHGIFWNLFHLPFYPWYVISGLPFALAISFVAQKTRNTWTSILLHALANMMMYTFMLMAIAGAL